MPSGHSPRSLRTVNFCSSNLPRAAELCSSGLPGSLLPRGALPCTALHCIAVRGRAVPCRAVHEGSLGVEVHATHDAERRRSTRGAVDPWRSMRDKTSPRPFSAPKGQQPPSIRGHGRVFAVCLTVIRVTGGIRMTDGLPRSASTDHRRPITAWVHNGRASMSSAYEYRTGADVMRSASFGSGSLPNLLCIARRYQLSRCLRTVRQASTIHSIAHWRDG